MWTRLRMQSKIVLVMTGFLNFFRDDRIFLFGISQSGDDGNDECRRKTDGIGVPVGDVENRGICGGVSGNRSPASKLLGCILRSFIGGIAGRNCGRCEDNDGRAALLVCISVLRI